MSPDFFCAMNCGDRGSHVDFTISLIAAIRSGTEGWDVKDLANLITRDAMIGTGLIAAPS